MNVAVLTIQHDLHAHVIKHELRHRHGIGLDIIEVDRLSAVGHIDWRLNSDTGAGGLIRSDDAWRSINELDVVWWRRSRAQQIFDGVEYPPEQERLINSECRSGIIGAFSTCFKGRWISHPFATERASNKLYQLSLAKSLGFRVPDTLISQSPDSITRFIEQLQSRKAIVKTISGGGSGLFLFTQFVTKDVLAKKESIKVCPAIYQEYIAGQCHIRLNCFGRQSFAAQIASDELDWRPNLRVPVTNWKVPNELHVRVRCVLDRMGLEMGVVDLKITPAGEVVWLEVNPQGQFLFLEPLTGTQYSQIFADYIAESLDEKRRGLPSVPIFQYSEPAARTDSSGCASPWQSDT